MYRPPVQYDHSSEARNSAMPSMSSGAPSRPTGTASRYLSRTAGSARIYEFFGVSIVPENDGINPHIVSGVRGAMTRVSPIIAASLVLYAVKASRQSNLSPQACRQVRESVPNIPAAHRVETNGPVMVAELSHVAVCIQPW